MKRLIFQCHIDDPAKRHTYFKAELFERAAAGEYWHYSFDTVRQYAERIGSDYECYTADKPTWAFECELFEKYRAVSRLGKYDQVLYLDSDILVHPNADNIFNEYEDAGCVGVYHNIVDRALRPDCPVHNGQRGLINSGVILLNNSCTRLRGKLRNFNITSAHRFNEMWGETAILDKYGWETAWWKDWDSRFKDELSVWDDGTPCEENLFHWLIYRFNCLPFHLDRVWNYKEGYMRRGRSRAQFLHYTGMTKQSIPKLYQELYPGRTP